MTEPPRQNYLAKRMKWSARVIGLVAAGFFLIFLIGEGISEIIDEGLAAVETAGILLAVLQALALAGTIISWRRERLAGVLLVAASVGLGVHIGVYAGRNHFLAWLAIGLPYLVAGGLFFCSRWLSARTA